MHPRCKGVKVQSFAELENMEKMQRNVMGRFFFIPNQKNFQ